MIFLESQVAMILHIMTFFSWQSLSQGFMVPKLWAFYNNTPLSPFIMNDMALLECMVFSTIADHMTHLF